MNYSEVGFVLKRYYGEDLIDELKKRDYDCILNSMDIFEPDDYIVFHFNRIKWNGKEVEFVEDFIKNHDSFFMRAGDEYFDDEIILNGGDEWMTNYLLFERTIKYKPMDVRALEYLEKITDELTEAQFSKLRSVIDELDEIIRKF